MATYLTKEKKAEIFAKHGGTAANTGSTQGQIALFTYRITSLSEHLKKNHKDHSTRRALLQLVGKRKALLEYFAGKDIEGYRKLIVTLGIRDVIKAGK